MQDLLLRPSAHQTRRELQDLILRDLLGPAGGEEEIVDESYVRDRYILGLLAPKGQSVIPDEEEDLLPRDGKMERSSHLIRNPPYCRLPWMDLPYTSATAIQIKPVAV